MKVVNKILKRLGYKVSKVRRRPSPSKQKREIFRDLESKFGDRFDLVWTNNKISNQGDFPAYKVPALVQRQIYWLSFISTHLRDVGDKDALDIASNIMWSIGTSCKFGRLTVADIRSHPCSDMFPFKYIHASMVDLPFDDASFDIVSIPQVLHHVGLTFGQNFDPFLVESGLKEVCRVLRVGGMVYGVTWIKPGKSTIPLGGARIFGIDDFYALVKNAGLRVRDSRYVLNEEFREIEKEEMRHTEPENKYRYFLMFTLEK